MEEPRGGGDAWSAANDAKARARGAHTCWLHAASDTASCRLLRALQLLEHLQAFSARLLTRMHGAEDQARHAARAHGSCAFRAAQPA